MRLLRHVSCYTVTAPSAPVRSEVLSVCGPRRRVALRGGQQSSWRRCLAQCEQHCGGREGGEREERGREREGKRGRGGDGRRGEGERGGGREREREERGKYHDYKLYVCMAMPSHTYM